MACFAWTLCWMPVYVPWVHWPDDDQPYSGDWRPKEDCWESSQGTSARTLEGEPNDCTKINKIVDSDDEG